jgi:hypothetical protein
MNWFEMPETTEKQRAEKEIAECNHCINGLLQTMKKMRVPKKEWGNNVMIKAYLNRIEKAKLILKIG